MNNGNYYIRNKDCACARCRAGGLIWAAILITGGLMYLVHVFTGIAFPRTFPVVLIVIGVVSLVGRTASTAGHIQSYAMPGQTAVSQQDPWASGRMTTPPPPFTGPAGSAAAGEPKQDDQQVKP
ncbi:MAG TPA: hypothetical protein VF532_24535 [Candidatus Angelobacter sp.]